MKKKRKEEERKALKPNSETRKNKGIGRKRREKETITVRDYRIMLPC